jgi:phage terminase small subunit
MPKEKKAVLKIKSKATPANRPKKIEEVKALECKVSLLTKEQELFCQYYVTQEFFANGTRSYIEAYGCEDEKGYANAKSGATRLLSNAHICSRINDLLDLSGLSDEFVDKQMAFLITQNSDLTNKLNAMKMYNDLRGRIVKKLEMTGKDGGAIKTESILNIKLL